MAHSRSLDASICFSDEAGFLRKSLPGGGLAFLRREFDCEGLRKALAEPDSLFNDSSKMLKDSRSSKVALSSIDGVGTVFVKKHNSKSLRYAIRYLFRKSRAFRTWQGAWLLEQLGVPTPKPIAAVAFRKAFFLKSSHLITEPIDGLLSAQAYLKELLGSSKLETFLLEVMKGLAAMHGNGISHGDLKLSNLAAVRSGAGVVFAGFMDLDSLKRRSGSLPERLCALELGRTAASISALSAELHMPVKASDVAQTLARCYSAAGGAEIDPESILEAAKNWME